MTSKYVLTEHLSRAVVEMLRGLRFDEVFPTCLVCKHWDGPGDRCGLYGVKPPAKVIVAGCPALETANPWDKKHPLCADDEIPF